MASPSSSKQQGTGAQQQFDLREELLCGDPSRQSRSLLAILGLLSAGKEVSSYTTLICQSILGNANVNPPLRATAYDVVAASSPSDADCARLASAIAADLQKGTPGDLRVKALGALELLPSHRVLGLVKVPAHGDRLVAALRSPSPNVRAASILHVLKLLDMDAVAAAAYSLQLTRSRGNATTTTINGSGSGGNGVGSNDNDKDDNDDDEASNIAAIFSDAVAAAEEGLTDDDVMMVAASCAALRVLMNYTATTTAATTTTTPGPIVPLPSGGGSSSSAPQQAATTVVLKSERARAAAVRTFFSYKAIEAMSRMFAVAVARFRSLPLAVQCEVPPLLCAYLRALDSPAPSVSSARGHAFEESAALMSEFVRSGDPPAVLAAAQGLFELADMDAASATLQALLPSAIAAAVGAATAAAGHQREVAQQAVLNLLLNHLDVLPSIQRAALFPRLTPMIAGMSAANDRVRALYLLWSAVCSYDWSAAAQSRSTATRSANVALPPPPPTTSQLQFLLLDVYIKEAVSGAVPANANATTLSPAGPPPHPRYREPIFREEMVGSLLYVLLTHPRPSGVMAASPTSSVTAASTAIAQASAAQAASAAVDWMHSANIALQGTKACLGWDRMAGMPTTGSTAAADMWLQLLLRCIQLSSILKVKLGPVTRVVEEHQRQYQEQVAAAAAAASAAANDDANAAPLPPQQPVPPVQPQDPAILALAGLVRRSNELEGEMQGMLLQIAANWRALHPMVRPRAVWLCACHLRLRSVVDAAWTSLADAIHGLLVDARAGERGSSVATGLVAAVTEGSLKAPSGPTRAGDGSTGTGASRHEAGVAAGAGEAEEVALLSLERMTGLLASAHHGTLEGKLSSVANLLEKLIGVLTSMCAYNPSSLERLHRMGEQLKPISTHTGSSQGGGGGGDATATTADGATTTPAMVVVELTAHISANTNTNTNYNGSQGGASYPSTLPTAAALFSAPEATRYRKFLEQLQAAALAKSIVAAGGSAAVAAAAKATSSSSPSSVAEASIRGLLSAAPTATNCATASAASMITATHGLPTLQQLATLLDASSVSQSDDASAARLRQQGGVEVTGPATPVTLFLNHTVDPGAGSIWLRCTVMNRTLQPLSGVAVTLLLGGPVAGNRRPLVYKLSTLPPSGEASVTQWEVPLLVNGFGWPVVQPAVTVPATVPSGVQPSLRCRPYSISPLQLLAPPSRAMSPAEFYQRWQAMPHKACLAAAPAEAGPLGVQRVLAAAEGAGLTCVMKAVVPVAGGVHAAFHGTSWSGGESISVVVTSAVEPSSSGGGGSSTTSRPTKAVVLHLHFGSESAEVVAHVRGHEGELLTQLTGGAAVPAVGAATMASSIAMDVDRRKDKRQEEEEDRPARISTFSFLRSVTMQGDVQAGGGGDEEDEDEVERVAAMERETAALQGAALHQWERVHAMFAAERS